MLRRKPPASRSAPETTEIDRKVAQIQRQIDAVTEPFQNQRGRLTVISYNIETAKGSAKDKYRKEAKDKARGSGRSGVAGCRRFRIDHGPEDEL